MPRRRWMPIGLTIVLLGGAVPAGAWTPPGDRSGPVSFEEPEVRESHDGVLEATLPVRRQPVDLGGRTITGWTYDGSLPGPTLKVRPGDVMRLRLVNELDGGDNAETVDCGRREAPPPTEGPEATLATNLHTHGLQVSPRANADNPFIRLRPGEACAYEIHIPDDHPAGMFWYHPHGHPGSVKQVWGGLAGTIIVEGDFDALPGVAEATERVMVLQELFVDHDGRVPRGVPVPTASDGPSPFSTVPSVPAEILYTVNGSLRPRLSIRPGETQRWRILNASPHRFFRLALEGHTLHHIAQDGLPLSETHPVEELVVAPGNRVEVIVRGSAVGSYRLRALAYEQGHPGGALDDVILAQVTSQGPPADGPLPGRLLPARDLRGAPVTQRRTVEWDGDILQAPVQFYIDHRQFEAGRVDQRMPVGGVEEWTLVNNDVFQHPFHIHVNPFQVVAVNGEPYSGQGDQPSWWDTFVLPPRTLEDGQPVPGTVTIRMFLRPDIPGATVFHCHILPHQDNGMMATIELTETDGRTATGPGEGEPSRVPPTAPRTRAPREPIDELGGGADSRSRLGGLPAGSPPTYVLTQHPCLVPSPAAPHPQGSPTPPVEQRPRCLPQRVAPGSVLEIQLPGTPSRWEVTDRSTGVELVGTRRVPSPGRIPGTGELHIFRFQLPLAGTATITLAERPSWVASRGQFTYSFEIERTYLSTAVNSPLAATGTVRGGPASVRPRVSFTHRSPDP